MASIRLAIVSDLHYERIDPAEPCRPTTARNGVAGDPMQALLQRIASSGELSADYLLCPGDITNKASAEGFEEGWARLKELQKALGAKHLLSVTGNHEVNSRAGIMDDVVGNSEQAIDPLAVIQKHPDYPSTALTDEERWVYWGRGYQIIDSPEALFLLINSSHFHPTTRANEFERGRVSEIALRQLRADLTARVASNKSRAFVALMHHHPIPHQPLDMPQDRIDMHNGSQLMEVLQETSVSWLVVHGHKHHGRLIHSQGGMGSPIVLAAGSFGAFLTGSTATQTRLQFYIVEVELLDQAVQPSARGHVRALSWTGSSWEPTRMRTHGLPDRCGYCVPGHDLGNAVDALRRTLQEGTDRFLTWDEALAQVPDLRHFMPNEARFLRKMMDSKEVSSTWPDDAWFPTEVSK